MKMHRLLPFLQYRILPLLLALGLCPLAGHAQTPPYMTYQGYLTDGNGNPLGSTNTGPKAYSVAFEIFTASTGGTSVFGELQTVTVDNGFFSVLLGQGSTYNSEAHTLSGSVFANSSALYVQMTVLGIGTAGANVTILPRLQLVSAPYAFTAGTAGALVNSTGATLISSSGTNVTLNGSLAAGSIKGNLTDLGGSIYLDNGAEIFAKNTAGTYEQCLFPRWTDNITYLNYGSAGFNIRNNSLNSTMWMGNNGNVGIGTINPISALGYGSTWNGLHTDSGNNGIGVIEGATTARLHLRNDSGTASTTQDFVVDNSANAVNFRWLGSGLGNRVNVMSFDPSGNVGLGGGALQINNYNTNALVIGGGWFSDTPSLVMGVNSSAITPPSASALIQAYQSYGPPVGEYGPYGSLLLNPSGGNVGIGTFSASYPLDVESTANASIANYEFLNSTGTGHVSPASGLQPFSIYAAGRIVTGLEFDALSDARIKEVVGRSDTRKDLAVIRKLQITDYRKIDQVQFGGQLEKGVIAQEVEKVIPEAVSTSTNFIPDIYALPKAFSCTNSVLLVTLATPHGLVVGDKVKVITEGGLLLLDVSAVPSPLTFAAGKVSQAPKKLFVYGKRVGDLRDVNYDRLFTTGLSAIQELAKHMDEVEAREAHLAELEEQAAKVDGLEREVADLKRLVNQLAEANQGRRQAQTAPTPRTPDTAAEVLTTASLVR